MNTRNRAIHATALAFGLALSLAGAARAADADDKKHSHLHECNRNADEKKLTGDARKDYVKQCVVTLAKDAKTIEDKKEDAGKK
ncbi:PsiF family protein [Derxia gummosa]|uniref:PsiF family protein n=1 Tax=Derxia gummosa DSM 723 TaxID=1121388 RepID=A0A8B6X830_9BURK|nr:PsiF family protein [Derxia gummosa]